MAAMKKNLTLTSLAFSGLLFLTMHTALAQLPQRDLIIEFRQIEDTSGQSVSTQASTPLLASQQVRVRNGEKAQLSMGQSMPMQWVQSAWRRHGVTQALTWMEANQRLSVQPRWPGVKQNVTVVIEVQSTQVEDRIGADLPNQSHSQVGTTVSAPLGQWITMAATGSSLPTSVYSSSAVSDARRLFQLRVLAP